MTIVSTHEYSYDVDLIQCIYKSVVKKHLAKHFKLARVVRTRPNTCSKFLIIMGF